MKCCFYLCLTMLLSLKGFCQTVRVAVAANAQFVAGALKEAFEQHDPARIELVVNSSGKITAQIEQGAPYAVFLSADMHYPGVLFQKGFAIGQPKIYASGKLVLWSLGTMNQDPEMKFLRRPAIKSIAVANPATAPYGVAAIQALKKTGIYGAIKDKIVYGESISQVNQYLLSGVAEAVFTAKSVVEAPDLKNKGTWSEVADSLYRPIDQGVVLLKYPKGEALAGARRFYHFLFSARARELFKAYGYQVR